MNIDERLREANTQLERVSIRRKSNYLYLRATLPLNPEEGVYGRHQENCHKQYELATKCSATNAGLKVAKAKVQELEGLLICEKFEWEPSLKTVRQKPPKTVREWVERFEKMHWERFSQTPTKENSYHKDYRLKFLRLPQDEPLTGVLLKESVLRLTRPATRSRKGFCMAYRLLAEFADIQVNLKSLDQGYSQKSVQPRDLPR